MIFTSFDFEYHINKSTPNLIKGHLWNCDKLFVPPLSSYVNIDEYGEKLFRNATNFEAWLDDKLIALVSVYCNDLIGGVAFVSNVSVEADYQKHGIALKLLSKAIDHVAKLGFLYIKLDVYNSNIRAKALYHALGFKEENPGEEKLTMIKYIHSHP